MLSLLSLAIVLGLHSVAADCRVVGIVSDAPCISGNVSVADAPGFTLAVQWHPEWEPQSHPLYDAIFKGFAAACATH